MAIRIKYICLYMYSLFYEELYTLRFYLVFYGDRSDVVLRAPLWIDLFRGRIVGLMLYLHRGWCGWRFNHNDLGKLGMPRYRYVAYLGQHQCRV